MRSRTARAALFALVTLAIALAPAALAPPGAAQAPPAGAATTAAVGPLNVTLWVDTPTEEFSQNVTANEAGTVWVRFEAAGNGTYNATATVRAGEGVQLEDDATFETGNVTAGAPVAHDEPFQVDEGAKGPTTFTVDVTVYRLVTGEPATNGTNGTDDGNATADRWEQAATGAVTHTVTIQAPAPVPPADEEPPWALLGAAGAVLLVGGGAAYAVYKRRQVPQVQPRSRALQETRMEREKPAVREEVRQQAQEQQRQQAKGRELQILEAKRDDLRRSIDLARRRVEAGELTEHQFQRIKEKKEAAIEDVLREIEEKRDQLNGA